jgi:hypothetical protein
MEKDHLEILLEEIRGKFELVLEDKGLVKLGEARKSGVEQMPDWLRKEMADAATDPDGYLPAGNSPVPFLFNSYSGSTYSVPLPVLPYRMVWVQLR